MTTPDTEEYQIGDTAEDADYGARLLVEGTKTISGALLWEYEIMDKPQADMLMLCKWFQVVCPINEGVCHE